MFYADLTCMQGMDLELRTCIEGAKCVTRRQWHYSDFPVSSALASDNAERKRQVRLEPSARSGHRCSNERFFSGQIAEQERLARDVECIRGLAYPRPEGAFQIVQHLDGNCTNSEPGPPHNFAAAKRTRRCLWGSRAAPLSHAGSAR